MLRVASSTTAQRLNLAERLSGRCCSPIVLGSGVVTAVGVHLVTMLCFPQSPKPEPPQPMAHWPSSFQVSDGHLVYGAFSLLLPFPIKECFTCNVI